MSFSFTNFNKPITSAYSNNSGSTISGATPVKATSTGINTINISTPTDVEALIGLTTSSIANGSNGQVANSGILPNINSFGPPYAFAAGDSIWIDSTGQALTNVPPTAGSNGFVAGMLVVKIGVCQPNYNSPSQIDLAILIENRGEL